MSKILFYFPEQNFLAATLHEKTKIKLGNFIFNNFPDNETYVKINSPVKNKKIFLLCSLNDVDKKILALLFFAKTAKELGAKEIILIAPYLAYMRQDKRFAKGEAISSIYFARLLSECFDKLITVDPHLHRYKDLKEIYSINAVTLHADDLIARWIKTNVKNPLLIGPDSESKQWVEEVAQKIAAPFLILKKVRNNSSNVTIGKPKILENFKDKTPVLIDDIIATANTMIKTLQHLHALKMKKAVCVGVHAIFVENSFSNLKKEHVKYVVTCNTIKHKSNKIDISDLLVRILN